ncbi:ribonuclease II [Limnohabitans sp. JirII-29]|uniref:ribonuclease catalytic domain-containing protein n=1 Tax=Limnohabitans sp. JirII-29 TaxID=1835756 RepID=UPI000D3728AB|nr:RNB domain-containing ribonuclease [Limnohabitans sp. JirII-29]PUE29290.1 ribonuclease II [Limnohabitans sp. JirII-29]
MYALFEEAGKFQTGRVLSEAESSAQIELESGKRVKVKAAQLLLKFDKPSPAELMREALALSATIELDLAWEFAPEDEFGFADLAREYFSAQATLTEQTAALLRLFEAPHYFRRAGKGRFKKASAEVIQQALAAIEKKKQIQEQINSWAQALTQGQCPEPVQAQLYKILFKPDKNAPEYKAVVDAARATQTAPLALLQQAGAITSAYQFHWQRFLFDNFPKGTGFPAVQAPVIADELPLAPVQAYSIDDSQTTEIDDALSVQGLGTGQVTLGIHIAAPGLALKPGDAIDQLGRQRLSTVYMPGYKVTMLPDAVVQTYTLQEGRDCPAVSLYVTFDETTLGIQHTATRVERVPIAANLRHDQLDAIVTEAWLNDANFRHAEGTQEPAMPRVQLAFLFRLAQHLKAQREVVRGKPENFNRPDYNFRLVSGADATQDPKSGLAPTGHEQVQISVRQRGAPLDLMVAEAMILANSTWGNWMNELGVPGIYRSQASLLPGVKVRMGTKALPHAGIGVPSYAWSTSPLRRYTDLVNQWQIIACAKHGNTAALAAPFKPKDAELFSIISAFDGAYSAYNGYQAGMERFWTLQYLKQHQITELTATVFKTFPGQPPMARADTLPLVLPVLGNSELQRGARVQLRLGAIDDITLDISGQFMALLDADQPHGTDSAEPAEDEDDSATAGPIAIAVDMDDAPAAEVNPA